MGGVFPEPAGEQRLRDGVPRGRHRRQHGPGRQGGRRAAHGRQDHGRPPGIGCSQCCL